MATPPGPPGGGAASSSLVGRILRAAFIWAIPVIVVIALWAPVGHLLAGGLLAKAFGAFLILVFIGALIVAAARTSADIVSGHYDARRAESGAPRPVVAGPSGRKRSAAVAILTTLAISSALTLLVLEIVFRTLLPQPLYAVQFAPWGFWHMSDVCFTRGSNPRFEGRLLRGTEYVVTVCYNSLGLRAREVPIAKDAGTKRIVVLGDSYGEGLEVEFDETVGQVLERLLNERLAAGTSAAARDVASSPTHPSLTDEQLGPEWRVTRAILSRLDREVSVDGARLLMANVHYAGAGFEARTRFFDAAGIAWVDVALQDPDNERPLYHYRYDGHWNPAGHARAAALIADRIWTGDLLGDGAFERVEVLNASMSAYSTCKMLGAYLNIARHYEPDLVLLVYTGADERNLDDLDICDVDDSGGVTVRERTYSGVQHALRTVRSLVRAHSHFGTWVFDTLDTVPWIAELRWRLGTQGEEPVPYIEEP